MNEDIFKKLIGNFFSPEIQGCIKAVESVTGFKLSAVDEQPFRYFDKLLTSPQPAFILAWRADPKLEKWYHRFAGGFSDVHHTMACVLYHHDRINEIETKVIEGIEKFNYREVLGNSTIALGNTLIWDFEYQAFILAYRRCLDYLARAICTYFKNDFNSFRKLGDFLLKAKPESVAYALIPVFEKYFNLFEFVLSEGNRKSVRDKITHYEYVSVGVINLNTRGLILAGGGEQIGISKPSEAEILSEILNRHVDNLKNCIREMIYCFVDSVQLEEKKW